MREELEFLREKIMTASQAELSDEEKAYWTSVFETPSEEDAQKAKTWQIEANAFSFLWTYLSPKIPENQPMNLTSQGISKVVSINSNRNGLTHDNQAGDRPTTEVTTEDWMENYQKGTPQAIFALAEKPYARLQDQLCYTVLTKGKKANELELIERIENTTFYFGSPQPNQIW